MLNKLPQLENTLIPESTDPAETVRSINYFIDNNSCENLKVDISFMNIMDSCYISTLCATKHFTKYPNGKIEWKVSSKKVQEFNKNLDLGNSLYILQ